jgi:uncharacterized protein (TIGR02118 family)
LTGVRPPWSAALVAAPVTILFLCRRRADVTRAGYVERLHAHVPLALRHHPALRRYVVNVVEDVRPGEPELDSVGELSFDSLEDYRERLYDSPEGEAIVRHDVAGFLGRADAYATTAHVQRDRAPQAPPGTRSPGVKLLCPLVRRPDLSHEAFVAHWLERHVPLALAHHPEMTRYVNHVVDAVLSPSAPPLDGIAALHFPSLEAVTERLFDSPDGERAVRADVARFIGHTAPYRVAEYVAKRGA